MTWRNSLREEEVSSFLKAKYSLVQGKLMCWKVMRNVQNGIRKVDLSRVISSFHKGILFLLLQGARDKESKKKKGVLIFYWCGACSAIISMCITLFIYSFFFFGFFTIPHTLTLSK